MPEQPDEQDELSQQGEVAAGGLTDMFGRVLDRFHDDPTEPAMEGEEASLPAEIGPYRILRKLGEGGMGTVYLAEQDQPRRTVALKVIRAGISNPEVMRRFRFEAEALGRLQHPGIARIYSAGTADTGKGQQPYFAMEYIEGSPLLEYTAGKSVDECIRLMIDVCEAVEHAHQRGIIHRDLKPANILVDAAGHPKVVDFGVARIVDSDVYATQHTDLGQLIGTVAYMSPEQALGDPTALDMRSDIYALGVIFYQLLAGRLPYDIHRFALHEAVRVIREEDPAPLSSINRSYRGDVEIIIGKALEKDRTRRYPTVSELRDDLRRHLQNEPIAARPASALYQLQKFSRRNRALVAGVMAVFVTLVLGVIASTTQAIRARKAESLARQQEARANSSAKDAQRGQALATQERANAEKERNAAVLERQRADDEAALAKSINDFLTNDLLLQADPRYQTGKPDTELRVRTAMDRAAERLAGKFLDQPKIQASLRLTIGQSYDGLGLYKEAQEQLLLGLDVAMKKLGRQSTERFQLETMLGETERMLGQYDDAVRRLVPALVDARRTLGTDDIVTLRLERALEHVYFIQAYYDRAEKLQQHLIAGFVRKFGTENRESLDAAREMIFIYANLQKFAEAQKLIANLLETQARVMGPDHVTTIKMKETISFLYGSKRQLAPAAKLMREVLEQRTRVLGPDNQETLNAVYYLAGNLTALGQYEESERLLGRLVPLWVKILGPNNRNTITAQGALASLYSYMGQLGKAEEMLLSLTETQRGMLPQGLSGLVLDLGRLAKTYISDRKYDEALKAVQEQVSLVKNSAGYPASMTAIDPLRTLARVLMMSGRYAEAEAQLRVNLEAEEKLIAKQGIDNLANPMLFTKTDMALNFQKQKRYPECEKYAREAYELGRKYSPTEWLTYQAEALIGHALAEQKQFAAAEPFLMGGYQYLRDHKPEAGDDRVLGLEEVRGWVRKFYADWGRPEPVLDLR